MSLFTQKMKMLTAVVLDGYSEAVVKILLEEGVMDFVHISDFQGELAKKLEGASGAVPSSAVYDLRVRCENLMKLGRISLPALEGRDLDNISRLDYEKIRKDLDRLSGSLNDLREEQKILSQRLLSCTELLSYIKEKKYDYIDLRCGSIDGDRRSGLASRIASFGGIVAEDEEGGFIVLAYKRDSGRVNESLDKFGWQESPKPPKNAMQLVLYRLEERKADFDGQNEELMKEIEEKIAGEKDRLLSTWKDLRYSELSSHVESYFSYTKHTTLFSGWVPSTKAEEVEKLIFEASRGKCLIEWTDDSEIERDRIPTSISSAKVLSPFERIVKNYGTPEYGSINPIPFTTVAYIIMFALMFADLGQGFILLLIALIGKHYYKTHPMAKDGLISRYLCSMLVFLGPASMVGGLLFGSCFGYSWIPAIWFNYHAVVNGHVEGGLVSSVYDILAITIYFGIIVISVGLILNWINLYRKKRYIQLIFDKNGLVGGLLYAVGVYACFYFVKSGYSSFPSDTWVYVLIVIGLVMLVVKTPVEAAHKAKFTGHKEPVGGLVRDTIMDFLVQALEIFSGFLSNTLSFMRVAGLGIAHVSLMTAFEDMAAMTGNIFAYVLIMVIGNVLVIALEGLSAGIQSLRLNYYEFFTKYFTGHGIAYEPVGLKSKINAN